MNENAITTIALGACKSIVALDKKQSNMTVIFDALACSVSHLMEKKDNILKIKTESRMIKSKTIELL